MKSTLIVGIGASLLTAGIAKAQQRQDITPRTPNVLFIYADDLGYGDCSKRYDDVAWSVIEKETSIYLAVSSHSRQESLADF